MKSKLIIVEDHPIVVFNLKMGLQRFEDIEIKEVCTSGKALLEARDLGEIDVVLLDINLPDIDGFKLCEFLIFHYPKINIIGISSFEDREHIKKLIDLGAKGYVVKGANNQELINAIREVRLGKLYFCQVAQRIIKENALSKESFMSLTNREKAILKFTKSTTNIKEISEMLGESEEITKIYLTMLKDKIAFYKLPVDLAFFE